MVRLAADGADVVLLQELPVWSFPHLAGWSGLRAFPAVAQRPRVGPLPGTAGLGRAVTELHHGLLRSAFTGQGNAILAHPRLRPRDFGALTLNPRSFRRPQAEWLELPLVAQLAWAKERRVVQALRVELGDGQTLLVANLHATSYPADSRLPDAELLRAAVWTDALAHPGEPVVLGGDLNVSIGASRTLPDLASAEWGFSGATEDGVDHVLVRGIGASAPRRWPPDRRRRGDGLLSDHAPVEVTLG
jgi:endonuclease/exonuclease/phosphatase family metal-dependent hydrolase